VTTPPPYGPGQMPSGQVPPGYPPSGGQPAYGQPPAYSQQPAYGQPAPYGQPYAQPYAAPMGPVYPVPAGSGRPGMVTAAAVLAFVFGGFAIIGGIVSTFLGTVANTVVGASCGAAGSLANSEGVDTTDLRNSCTAVRGIGTFAVVVGIGLIVVAAFLIWGGVVAITGKSQQILVIGAGIYIVLVIVNIFALGSFGFLAVTGFIAPVLILVFLFANQSRAWFRAKGAKTF
jgi:hypothetical protein